MATPYQNLMDMRNKAYNKGCSAHPNDEMYRVWWYLSNLFEQERTYMLYDGLKAMAQRTR